MLSTASTVNTKQIPGTEPDKTGAVENWVDSLYVDRHPTFDKSGKVAISDLTSGDWARLAVGVNSITPSAAETSQKLSDYASKGHSETVVTGKDVTLTISGNRYVGNPGQEYVASMWLKMGNAVKTRCIYIVNGQAIESACTITAIVPTGGNANASQTFSCTINLDGVPVEPASMLTLTESKTESWVYTATVSGDAQSDPDTGRETNVTVHQFDDESLSSLVSGGSSSSQSGNVQHTQPQAGTGVLPATAVPKK